jgi:hypothetical protein
LLNTHLSSFPEHCDIYYPTAYHILGLLDWGFFSDPGLTWLRDKEVSVFEEGDDKKKLLYEINRQGENCQHRSQILL